MRGFVLGLLLVQACTAAAGDRITIITDAFGRAPRLEHDWGYAAQIGGKRILFDAGNDARKFERNVRV